MSECRDWNAKCVKNFKNGAIFVDAYESNISFYKCITYDSNSKSIFQIFAHCVFSFLFIFLHYVLIWMSIFGANDLANLVKIIKNNRASLPFISIFMLIVHIYINNCRVDDIFSSEIWNYCGIFILLCWVFNFGLKLCIILRYFYSLSEELYTHWWFVRK